MFKPIDHNIAIISIRPIPTHNASHLCPWPSLHASFWRLAIWLDSTNLMIYKVTVYISMFFKCGLGALKNLLVKLLEYRVLIICISNVNLPPHGCPTLTRKLIRRWKTFSGRLESGKCTLNITDTIYSIEFVLITS